MGNRIRHVSSGSCLLLAAALVACGGEGDSGGETAAEPEKPVTVMAPPIDVGEGLISEGAGEPSGPGDGAAPGVVMMGAVATADPSQADTPNTEASSSETSGAAPAEPSGRCASSEVMLEGTLSGEAFAAEWNRTSSFTQYYSEHQFNWSTQLGPGLDVGGQLFLTADAQSPITEPEDLLAVGETLTLTGGMFMPPPGDAATVYCIGAGSTLRREESEMTLELTGISLLGTCPGAPVEGSMEVCFGNNDLCTGMGGTLNGVEHTDNAVWGGGLNEYWNVDSSTLGVFRWYRAIDEEAQSGSLANAVLFTHGGVRHGGVVYCIADANWTTIPPTDGFQDATLFSLNGFTSLGSCEAQALGTDTLSGCIR